MQLQRHASITHTCSGERIGDKSACRGQCCDAAGSARSRPACYSTACTACTERLPYAATPIGGPVAKHDAGASAMQAVALLHVRGVPLSERGASGQGLSCQQPLVRLRARHASRSVRCRARSAWGEQQAGLPQHGSLASSTRCLVTGAAVGSACLTKLDRAACVAVMNSKPCACAASTQYACGRRCPRMQPEAYAPADHRHAWLHSWPRAAAGAWLALVRVHSPAQARMLLVLALTLWDPFAGTSKRPVFATCSSILLTRGARPRWGAARL